MVTRAINFKVIVPRQADEAGSATVIWSTHREVNLATRYYEEIRLQLPTKNRLMKKSSINQLLNPVTSFLHASA